MIFPEDNSFPTEQSTISQIQNSVYTLKNFSISVFHRQLYCWMQNCFSACIFSVIQATSKSDRKLVFALQFLQGITGSPVVGSISSCPEYLQLLRASTVVQSTHNYRKHLQLSGLPTVVESTFSCPKYLQLSKVPPAVGSTSSFPEYLQLWRAHPAVLSTSRVQVRGTPRVIGSDFCQTGSVM